MDLNNVSNLYTQSHNLVGGAVGPVKKNIELFCPFVPDAICLSNVAVNVLTDGGGDDLNIYYITCPSLTNNMVIGLMKLGTVQTSNNLYIVNNNTGFNGTLYEFNVVNGLGRTLEAQTWDLNLIITYIKFKK